MSLETSKILFRSQIFELYVVVPRSFPFLNRIYTICLDFSSLSRFGFVLTWNGFKFETRVNYMIINHILTSKTYYNPKRVVF